MAEAITREAVVERLREVATLVRDRPELSAAVRAAVTMLERETSATS